jgi:hypothetical protein
MNVFETCYAMSPAMLAEQLYRAFARLTGRLHSEEFVSLLLL